jgi:hypothetical protein
MVDFIADTSIVSTLPDQFKPYEAHKLDWRSPFPGTLFRLPLRSVIQAETSLLSKRALSIEEATHLLNNFASEASSMVIKSACLDKCVVYRSYCAFFIKQILIFNRCFF